jgi:hypothetical protein
MSGTLGSSNEVRSCLNNGPHLKPRRKATPSRHQTRSRVNAAARCRPESSISMRSSTWLSMNRLLSFPFFLFSVISSLGLRVWGSWRSQVIRAEGGGGPPYSVGKAEEEEAPGGRRRVAALWSLADRVGSDGLRATKNLGSWVTPIDGCEQGIGASRRLLSVIACMYG